MRLLKFLSLSLNEKDINTFRQISIRLSNGKERYNNLISNMEKRFGISEGILEELHRLNCELSKIYDGEWKFQFCNTDDGRHIDEVNIGRKGNRKIRRMMMEANDRLSGIKLDIEKSLQK